jgi:hypothetical protein
MLLLHLFIGLFAVDISRLVLLCELLVERAVLAIFIAVLARLALTIIIRSQVIIFFFLLLFQDILLPQLFCNLFAFFVYPSQEYISSEGFKNIIVVEIRDLTEAVALGFAFIFFRYLAVAWNFQTHYEKVHETS